jgi:hypothetical protein
VSHTRRKTAGIRFKLHDKVTALAQIAKHLGMFGDFAGDLSFLSKLSDEGLEQQRRKFGIVK